MGTWIRLLKGFCSLDMDPIAIIETFYRPGTRLYQVLVDHSRIVTEKSLEIARSVAHLNPDLELIKTAAMLHDIGIFMTRADALGCRGDAPYICHGYLGRKLLDEQGLPPEYGLVCERHTGAGITRENILANDLPLPRREMVPISLEEKIICVADKYHSKDPRHSDEKKTTRQIIESLEKIDQGHAGRFSAWAREFRL